MKQDHAILLMFHCEENTGYAIASLEHVFLAAAKKAGFSESNIFWSFSKITSNEPNIIQCDYNNPNQTAPIATFIKKNNIKTAIAFDLGFPKPIIGELKRGGVEYIISYWGASMSSINSGLKLLFKKLEYNVRRNTPDIFVFESEAMRKTGTHGRGISATATQVIYLGVDVEKFTPDYGVNDYTHRTLNIPRQRKIVFYSGHMEERKGVRVITKAAIELVDQQHFLDIHFVICGNKNNEADDYLALLKGTAANDHVTFAGYRNDIPELMRGSHIGVIASTGWDSFTMSSIEMMASGLPLIVSNLQGLSETINENENGYLITPGNHLELAAQIAKLANQPELAAQFSQASRQRAETLFAKELQIDSFAQLFQR